MKIYESRATFNAENPMRGVHEASDKSFGVGWRTPTRPATHRIMWIRATGEVYVESLNGQIEILAEGLTEDMAAFALVNWQDVVGMDDSLSWARARLEAANMGQAAAQE